MDENYEFFTNENLFQSKNVQEEVYNKYKKHYCNEILENINRCLIKCRDNKKTHYFKNTFMDKFNISDCDNVLRYKENIEFDTKIKFLFLKNEIDTAKNYTIEYKLKDRLLIFDQKV